MPQTVTHSGFRIDASKLRRKLARMQRDVTADAFRPLLLDFVRKSLATAARVTPVRSPSVIRRAQRRQYSHRVNYIPSFHTVEDPALIVKPNGHWLHYGGKWYRAGQWRLPPDVDATYQRLLAEHMRRASIPREQFIRDRANARGLYAKTWAEIGQSIGLNIGLPKAASGALTRRKPPQNPPKGYAQIRGGKSVLNVLIRNPFLAIPSRYKTFDAGAIIGQAIAKHQSNFDAQLTRQLNRMLYAIMHGAA